MPKGIIYKYPLTIGETTVLELPEMSLFLSVKVQNDNVVAYFLLNENPTTTLARVDKFYTVGTGHSFELDEEMEFIDTVLLYNDTLVLHVFKL